MSFFDCFYTIVTELTTYHRCDICEKNIDKGNIKNTQIKCTIIVIVQCKILEDVPFVVQFYNFCNGINIYN